MGKPGRLPTLTGKLAQQGARAIEMERLDGAEQMAPPKNLAPAGQWAWRHFMRSISRAGMLAHGDIGHLIRAAHDFARWYALEVEIAEAAIEGGKVSAGEIDKTSKGNLVLSAKRIAADRAWKSYHEIMSAFGITPVARIKTSGAAQGDFFNALDQDLGNGAQASTAGVPTLDDPTDPFGTFRGGPQH